MLDSEEEEMRELSEELVTRFSNHYYVLESDSVASMLEEPKIELGPIPSPENYMKKEEEVKPPVTLTKGGIIVKIYNNQSDLVYETEKTDLQFKASEQREVSEISGPAGTALSMVEPVQSKYHGNLLGYVQIVQTLKGYHEMTDDITYSIIIIGLGALIFSSIIGWLLINSFVKPITQLTSAMESIQDNLESDVRLDEGTKNNELSKLARTYNNMVDLMQGNITSQRQFVEDVSHELRTPVAIVEGHLKMLNRWGKDDPEVLEESIEASLTETQRMKSLVQEMLDLSRVQEIDVHYKHEQTNIISLIEQLVGNFRMLYPDFTFTIDEDFKGALSVYMYRNHLEQVLVNVLDNAVKYSVDRKEIHISLSVSNDWVNLSIQDFGSGMENEDLEKIFNRFYRVDKARSREKGGTGLGLPIVKELVEGYGGEVKVTSVIDQGTIFNIKLPIIESI
ncbi:MAG: HAMP domain-containing histidine kinase [Atopostipes suicloacalis]|nr:HAMP domain-containing histidine kinase [Atopostipes suicloacalis]